MNELTGTASLLPNSASARGLAFVLHPMTNLVQHAAEGAALQIYRGTSETIYGLLTVIVLPFRKLDWRARNSKVRPNFDGP
jgi:hypothetical protein